MKIRQRPIVRGNPVITTLPRPSALVHAIQLEQVGHRSLFKFTDSLQQRLEYLLDQKKADELTPEETAELEAISELDRIFTHINGLLAAHNAH